LALLDIIKPAQAGAGKAKPQAFMIFHLDPVCFKAAGAGAAT
jgi:hypothetical protein